jgi:hypothetical protein
LCSYGQIEPFEDYNQCLIGFRNPHSKEVLVAPKYERVEYVKDQQVYMAFLEDSSFVLNRNGKEIREFQNFKSFRPYQQKLFLRYEDSTLVLGTDLQVLYRSEGELSAVYSNLKPLLYAVTKNGSTSVLDARFHYMFKLNGSHLQYCELYSESRKNRDEISFQPDGWSKKSRSYLRFIRNGKIGVTDMLGKVIIEPEYKYIAYAPLMSYQKELFEFWLAKKDNEIGLIDTAKNFIPIIKDKHFWNHFRLKIFPLYCGNEMGLNRFFAAFSYLGGHNLIDLSRGKKIKGSYDGFEPGCGVIHFKKGKRTGIINSYGQVVHEVKSEYRMEKTVHYFSKIEIKPYPRSNAASNISPELYLRQLNPYMSKTGRIGLMNHVGERLTEPLYYKFIYAEKDGKEVVWCFRSNPEEWKSRVKFIDVIDVKSSNIEGIYLNDKSFNSYIFQNLISGSKEKHFLKLWTGKFVLVDRAGNRLSKEFDDYGGMFKSPVQDEKGTSYELHYLLKDNKWGSLDENLKEVIPFRFDSIRQNYIAEGNLFFSEDGNFYQSKNAKLEIEGDSFDILYKSHFPGNVQRLNNLISNKDRRAYLLVIKNNVLYAAKYNGELVAMAELLGRTDNGLLAVGKYLINQKSEIVHCHDQQISPKHDYAFIINTQQKLYLYDMQEGKHSVVDSVYGLRYNKSEEILIIQHVNRRYSAFDLKNRKWLVQTPVYAMVVNQPYPIGNNSEKEIWYRTLKAKKRDQHIQNWVLNNEDWKRAHNGIDFPFYSHFYSVFDESSKQYQAQETEFYPFSKNDRYDLMKVNGDSATAYSFSGYYTLAQSPFYWFEKEDKLVPINPKNAQSLGTFEKVVFAPIYNDDFIVFFDTTMRLGIKQVGGTSEVLIQGLGKDEFLNVSWSDDFHFYRKMNKDEARLGQGRAPFDTVCASPFKNLLHELCPSCTKELFSNKVLWDYFSSGTNPSEYIKTHQEMERFYSGSVSSPESFRKKNMFQAKVHNYKVLFSDSMVLSQNYIKDERGRIEYWSKSFFDNQGVIDTLKYEFLFEDFNQSLLLQTRNYLVDQINKRQLFGKNCPNIEAVVAYMMENVVVLGDGLYFIPEKFKHTSDYWIKLEDEGILNQMKNNFSVYLQSLNQTPNRAVFRNHTPNYGTPHIIPVQIKLD